MRDPIDSLERLDPGTAMEPLPATEIRRRGDRRRRRRIASTAVGALIAVAAISVPIAWFGSDRGAPIDPATGTATSDATSDPSGPPTSGDASTTFPEGFSLDPLIAAANVADSGWSFEQSDDATGVGPLELCGQAAFGEAGVTDRLAADSTTSEGVDTAGVEVRLYRDEATASAALDAVDAAARSCQSEDIGGQSWTVVERSASGEDDQQQVLVVRAPEEGDGFGLGVQMWGLVRVGSSVAAVSASYEHLHVLDDADEAGVATRLASPVAMAATLCVFSAEGCETGATDPATRPTGGTALTEIPDDFPITAGLPDGADYEMVGPAERGELLETPTGIAPCGLSVWPAGGIDTLDVAVHGPEWWQTRELAVYASADEAVAVVQAAREALEGCETYPGGGLTSLLVLDGGTGYDDVTFGSYDSSGAPNGTVFQLMRVGSAVLVSSTASEYTVDSLPAGAEALTEDARTTAAAMCVFTEAGC